MRPGEALRKKRGIFAKDQQALAKLPILIEKFDARGHYGKKTQPRDFPIPRVLNLKELLDAMDRAGSR